MPMQSFWHPLAIHKPSPNFWRNRLGHDMSSPSWVVLHTMVCCEPAAWGRFRQASQQASSTYGIRVEGVADVMLRLAKCCRPVPGDPIVGYISLGKGITIHNEHCPNARALMKNPERFTPVAWEGDTTSSFRVELQIDGWDRHRLLEDLSRTFAETGINILEARCTVVHPMVKNRFVVEVGDTESLRTCIARIRNIDSVFDAYRVTPTG